MSQKTHGVIAAGHPKTAEAGIEMLRNGGNAFDAAVAASLASFVTEPGLTSAGGGGFLLAHTCTNQNILFDFFTRTPGRKRNQGEINFYPVEMNFGGAVQEFHIGLASMAVPGNVAGAFHVHQRLGRLPFAVVAEPAIDYARNGVKLNRFQSYSLLEVLRPIVISSKEGCQIFLPTNRPIEAGGTLVMREFAETLRNLVAKGPKEFYEGEIAHQLVKDCQNKGGHITLEDLKNYQVIERQPLMIDYRGNKLLTNPPPSSGGTLIACSLKLLSAINLTSLKFGTARHLAILAQVMQLTNEARKDGYDAKLYQAGIAQEFLADAHLARYENRLTETINKWGSTTHLSVVDSEGNAASVTTSNGEGSGYVIPGTGIMVNNMLGEDDLNPQGFHQWRENMRISSMMAPTIVLKDNQPEIVLGSGGSKRIRTAILQVISNILDFQMPASQAVDSPRVHWDEGVFHLEPGFAQEEVDRLRLLTQGELVPWQERTLFFGGVHTVLRTANGWLEGASDPRRDGGIARC